ncbi:MAG: hypothetical protein HKN79_03025 [Flavobacteriales bacterium]|nr:hypothetical protein [Flavobacteriales bacterium]
MRRIILFSVLLLSLAAIIFILFIDTQPKTERSSILDNISSDACVVLEIDDLMSWNETVRNGSVLWPEAATLPGWQDFESALLTLERHLSTPLDLKIDSTWNLIFSLHPTGAQGQSWMASISLPTELSSWDANSLAEGLGVHVEMEKVYDEVPIFKTSYDEGILFVSVRNGVVQISRDILCIEKHLRPLPESLSVSRAFMASRETRGNQQEAHLHINWSKIGSTLRSLLPHSQDAHLQTTMGVWSTADILSKPNSIYFNGLIQTPDSLKNHLSPFRKEGRGSIDELLDIIPDHCSQLIYEHIKDFSPYIQGDSLSLLDFIGAGMARVYIDDGSGALPILMARVDDANGLQAHLDASFVTSRFMGLPVWAEVGDAGLDSLLEGYDISIEQPILGYIDDALIIAPDQDAIEEFYVKYRASRTLASNPHFKQLQDDLDDRYSILYYFDLQRLSQEVDWSTMGAPLDRMASHTEVLEKFQALVIQYEPAGEGLFHQHALLRYNPSTKSQSGSIWEMVLDHGIEGRIHTHKNHYTQQYEILIQDSTHSLSLIDNLGKTLWTRDLDGPIHSEITQVDIYKNGKLQMLFSTDGTVYGLDRKGRDLEGFPLRVEGGLSAPIAVLDYDKNRSYRILIPTHDGMVLNYTTDGSPVDGWKFKSLDVPVIDQIKHFSINNKDYIMVIDADLSVRFLRRDGKVRYGGDDLRLADGSTGPFHVIAGKNIKQSSIVHHNAQGALVITELSGPTYVLDEKGQIDPPTQKLYSLQDGMFIRFDENRKELSRIELPESELELDLISQVHYGFRDSESQLYYLYDSEGTLEENFPVPGSTASVQDMDGDGRMDLIVLDANGILYRYALD